VRRQGSKLGEDLPAQVRVDGVPAGEGGLGFEVVPKFRREGGPA
jgi:tripartite-type tricarboxylate transporter receptor subunit TctC